MTTSGFCDLLEAELYEGEGLTWQELTTRLGVKINENGNLPGIELFNACLDVLSNPNLATLSHEERIRTIRSAADALTSLRS
jgi:hypothetical protein